MWCGVRRASALQDRVAKLLSDKLGADYTIYEESQRNAEFSPFPSTTEEPSEAMDPSNHWHHHFSLKHRRSHRDRKEVQHSGNAHNSHNIAQNQGGFASFDHYIESSDGSPSNVSGAQQPQQPSEASHAYVPMKSFGTAFEHGSAASNPLRHTPPTPLTGQSSTLPEEFLKAVRASSGCYESATCSACSIGGQ
jgi:hypothetical protein